MSKKKPMLGGLMCENCEQDDAALIYVYSGVWLQADTLEPAQQFEVDTPGPDATTVCLQTVELKDGSFVTCEARATVGEMQRLARGGNDGKADS